MADDREPPELHEIYAARAEGQLFAELQGERRYLLMAYEVFPNGTSADLYVTDPDLAKDIGRRAGLGDPDDPAGYAIWYVPGEEQAGT
jgi:hypothetical protein